MSPLKKLTVDRRGAVAMIIALGSPMLIGGMGLSIDTIQWTIAKRELQRQADSAAIAGAFSLAQGANVTSSAAADLARNASLPLSLTRIENAPTAGSEAGNARAVRVVIASQLKLPFSGALLGGAIEIPAEATVSGGYSNGNVNSNQTRTLSPGNDRGMDL
jgi:uncharacterized membrane protein